MTTEELIQGILTAKESIRQSIINKNVDVPEEDKLSTYADKISKIVSTEETMYYTGETEPANTLGKNGDLYLQL